MPIDQSKYLGLFLSEASEHLDAFASDLIRLEKDRSISAVDSLFRHAHSVKGMAASLNLDAIASLAHRVEDLVDLLRRDIALAQGAVIDLLLASHDDLAAMVKATAAGKPPSDPGPNHGRLGELIDKLRRESPPAEAPTDVAPAPATPPQAEAGVARHPRLAVKVQITPQSPVPGVRAFLVHKKLSGLGRILVCVPSLEELKAGRVPNGVVSLEVETAAGEEAVRKALAAISDVQAAEVSRAITPEPPAPPEPRPMVVEPSRTVRVHTDVLDRFLDDVGELLIATSRMREVAKRMPEDRRGPLEEVADQIHGIGKDLHAHVMAMRLTPLALITDRMPRVVRDVAKARNKEVAFSAVGTEIELDRTILDQLADPLLHVLRNAVDHGIEDPEARAKAGKPRSGQVRLTAYRERDKVVVEISDDGRGMDAAALRAAAVGRGQVSRMQAEALTDRDALRLALLPGVSTAKTVTEVSGRGVGLDVVARAVELVNGVLELASKTGEGTRIILRLPLTVSVINVLLVGVGREIFGLPIGKVLQVVEADPTVLERSRRTPLVEVGGTPLSVRPLGQLLGIPAPVLPGVKPLVVVDAEQGRVAIEVDRLVGQEEAVLKPLSRPLDLVPGVSGVTILGTGRPVFILDVPRLIAA